MPSGSVFDAPQVVLRAAGQNQLTVVVSVASGARVKQITDGTGRRWLADPGRADPPAGDLVEFAAGTRGGWDECLPSIAKCQDPNPRRGEFTIPDHGVFWMRPWRIVQLSDSTVKVDSDPIDHPLRVRKTLTLTPGSSTLETRIRITNVGHDDYGFLYSAHPLWDWQEAAIIEVPGSTALRPGFGSSVPDLRSDSTIFDPSGERENFKYFLRWSGDARLRFPSVGAKLSLRDQSDATPWLGVCINRGAWPSTQENERWIALEPTNAPTDSLVEATAQHSSTTLVAGESVEWASTVTISYDSP